MTVPYTSADCAEMIRRHTGGRLKHAIDCITSPESVRCCFAAMARAGGRYASLEYAPEEWRTRKTIQVDMPIAYVITGKEVKLGGAYHRDADPSKFELAVRWREEVEKLVADGQLESHPVWEIPGQWEGIIKGLDMLKAGQVRGQKLVVRVAA